ncbi:hypothetical protein ACFWM3_20460 [Gottfriedia sp. NPDC058432]|uniref:hypothetical protein n=1 Tax=Gottfriedia sp. NPDC058432 TaxID=3346497 RepID=UPI0036506414
MNANTLMEWEQKHDAKNRTINGFWECFRKWREEEKYDYLDTFKGKLYEEFIQVKECSIALKHSFSRIGAFVFFTVDICYFDKEIGTYSLEFDLDGEVLDDFLVFDSILLDHRISEIRHNLTTVRKALKEGIELNLISNITGIDQPSIEIIKKKYC